MTVERVDNCEVVIAVIQVAVDKFEWFSNLSKETVVNLGSTRCLLSPSCPSGSGRHGTIHRPPATALHPYLGV